MTQDDLFGGPAQAPKRNDRDRPAKRQLGRQLRAVPKGGLVNGMSKEHLLRRYAPARLPRVTIHE